MKPATSTEPTRRPEPAPEALGAARDAGLRYYSDDQPGISRRGSLKRFSYRDANGRAVKDRATLARIRALAVPPAWTDVWICPSAQGHIQATGRDGRVRKQYRYHADWQATRDATKFERMAAFGAALPRIRQRVARDLRRPGLGREKVLAVIVRLLETTLIRVGNEEYVRQNKSFGLTTLRDRHVSVRGGRIHFHFLGKSGKVHDIDLHDRRLSLLVKRLQDLPGQDLFQFLDDDGKQQGVSSEDINTYVREAAGDEFSAKDFRTWWGTTLAALAFCEACRDAAAPPTKRRMKDVIVQVAGRLGNTPTICRKSYIHPAVLDGYLGGRTLELASPSTAVANGVAVHRVGRGLSPEEKAVLRFLRAQRRRRAPSLTEALEKSIGK